MRFDFGGYTEYIPFFIVVPFLIYCSIAISMEILIRKEFRKSFNNEEEVSGISEKYDTTELLRA